MRQVQKDLFHQLGRQPTMEEMAVAAESTIEQTRTVLQMNRSPASLHDPVGRGAEREFGELIPRMTTGSQLTMPGTTCCMTA